MKTIYTTILLVLLSACGPKGQDTTDLTPKNLDDAWHASSPWIDVVFETMPLGNERAVYTQAGGTICRYDMARTDTEMTFSNPVTILQRLGDPDCGLFAGAWQYQYTPGHLQMLEEGHPGTTWIEFN